MQEDEEDDPFYGYTEDNDRSSSLQKYKVSKILHRYTWQYLIPLPATALTEAWEESGLRSVIARWTLRFLLQTTGVWIPRTRTMEYDRQAASGLQPKAQGDTQEDKEGIPGDTGISSFDPMYDDDWLEFDLLSK